MRIWPGSPRLPPGRRIDTASLVGASEATGTREWLKARVLQMVEDESDIDPDENLIFYGLDSLQVMKLAGELKERGVTVGFDELARVPTLSACSRRFIRQ